MLSEDKASVILEMDHDMLKALSQASTTTRLKMTRAEQQYVGADCQ